MTIHEAVIEEIERRIEVLKKAKVAFWRIFKKVKIKESIKTYKGWLNEAKNHSPHDNSPYDPQKKKIGNWSTS